MWGASWCFIREFKIYNFALKSVLEVLERHNPPRKETNKQTNKQAISSYISIKKKLSFFVLSFFHQPPNHLSPLSSHLLFSFLLFISVQISFPHFVSLAPFFCLPPPSLLREILLNLQQC